MRNLELARKNKDEMADGFKYHLHAIPMELSRIKCCCVTCILDIILFLYSSYHLCHAFVFVLNLRYF